MANDARDLTTLWRDIEEVTDALEAAIAQLVRSAQPHPKLVEALIIDLPQQQLAAHQQQQQQQQRPPEFNFQRKWQAHQRVL
ncbi:hypothetical protein OEZ85_000047 [Tetradesmus obliquus]|uniref:Mediator of RNA polymerase II transcription subunit 21 n=1 Tax=Tetradesmus obliquus TaxID=3088 RepID=A0ABY8UPT7_TETOB|nr:hypothetical protein OEZ85_000047 [Tetradesmus obliquus]